MSKSYSSVTRIHMPRKQTTFLTKRSRTTKRDEIHRMARFAIFAAILFLSSLLTSIDALYGPSSPVHQLTPSNFKSKVLDSNRVVLVEFFAPWCGHCQQLTPIWEKAATVLKGVATVAAIDVDAHQSFAQDYGIQGFPTIKVFVPGKPPAAYEGARDAKAIVNFAVKQIKQLLKDRLDGKTTEKSSVKSEQPNASVELTSSNFDETVLKSKDLWIVEFFAPWCGHCKKLAPEWKKAANNLKGKVKLGHVNCDDEKVEEQPHQLNHLPWSSLRQTWHLVTELTSEAVLKEKCGPAAICFVSFLPDILDSKAGGRNKYLHQLLTVAEKFKRSPYSYVWAAAGKQPDLEKHVGVGGYGYPAMVALNLKKGAYAPLRGAFGVNQIIEFVKEAADGGKGIVPLLTTPKIETTEAWDGKDGEIIEEDEFSLDELMGGDDTSTTKGEL